eukprot:gene42090-56988_t
MKGLAYAYVIPPLTSHEPHQTQALSLESPSSSYNSMMVEYDGASTSAVSYGNGFKRDLWAAVLFLLNIVCITWLAVQAYYASTSAITTNNSSAIKLELGISPTFATAIVSLSIVIPIFGYMWLSFMISHAENLIEFVMMSNVVICAVIAVISLLSGQIIGTVLFGALSVINYCYLQSVRPRIPFASAVINAACSALLSNYSGLSAVSLVFMFLQLLWLLTSSAAFYFAVHFYQLRNQGDKSTDDGTASIPGLVMFIMLVSYFWGLEVLKNVVATT